jgi:hypothetical protein
MYIYKTQLLLQICLSKVSFDMIQVLNFYVILNRLLLIQIIYPWSLFVIYVKSHLVWVTSHHITDTKPEDGRCDDKMFCCCSGLVSRRGKQ